MITQFNTEELVQKIKAGIPLSDDEDIYYLVHVLKFARNESDAQVILAIAKNTDKNLLID
jgi:gluconate kinase